MKRVASAALEENAAGKERAPATPVQRGWKAVALEVVVLVILFVLAASFALLPTMINLWRHF